MKRIIACFLILGFTLSATPQNGKKEPIRIIILGTYHMGNPGLDLHNMKADDVTSPARQRELEDVAGKLAKFHPTKIALERLASNENLIDTRFEAFTADQLKKSKDERVQIGYRLAFLQHHSKVFGIDEQSDEIDYFPYNKVQKFAVETARVEYLNSLSADIEVRVKSFEQSQSKKTVAQLLMNLNDPAEVKLDQQLGYYSLLSLSDRSRSPGAELNAYWYMRNAKIFSKLLRIAEPGDRIIVLFGAGHNFWLRHFVENTAGCELVEPNDYLRAE